MLHIDRARRRALTSAYQSTQSPAQHHIESFNEFLRTGMQSVINRKDPVETDIASEDNRRKLQIEFGKLRVEQPKINESDGVTRKIFPQEARMRNLTYAGPTFLTIKLIEADGQERVVHEEAEVKVGQLPVMVGSSLCRLPQPSNEEQRKYGEDPLDPGGYFIVSGTERVMPLHEDLAKNTIISEIDSSSAQEAFVSKMHSQNGDTRRWNSVRLNPDGNVLFKIYGKSFQVTTILRSFGLENDNDIAERFRRDPKTQQRVLRCLENATVENQQEGLERIGRELAPSYVEFQHERSEDNEGDQPSGENSGSDEWDPAEEAKDWLARYILPHCERRALSSDEITTRKAYQTIRMAQACIDLELGRISETDKDHYRHKRLRTPGDLMQDLFRKSIDKLARDAKYRLLKAHQRGRTPSIRAAVKGDIVTNHISGHVATGQWPFGRSGVTQFVDRTNYQGLISQLNRIQSPLARSRPHFDARDLHATHWGRVCPSETPEGQNCGLTKHLALGSEISTDVEEKEELLTKLSHLGIANLKTSMTD